MALSAPAYQTHRGSWASIAWHEPTNNRMLAILFAYAELRMDLRGRHGVSRGFDEFRAGAARSLEFLDQIYSIISTVLFTRLN